MPRSLYKHSFSDEASSLHQAPGFEVARVTVGHFNEREPKSMTSPAPTRWSTSFGNYLVLAQQIADHAGKLLEHSEEGNHPQVAPSAIGWEALKFECNRRDGIRCELESVLWETGYPLHNALHGQSCRLNLN
jgi:hypothetical protein